MTIFIGSVTQQGNKLGISPPAALSSVKAVRVANITSDVLILNNIAGNGQSQEYLLPLQQAVYKTEGVQQIPTLYGQALGDALPLSQIFVEWSDDPLADFPGTYPTTLSQLSATAPSFVNGIVTLTNANQTYNIPQNVLRTSITFVNTSTSAVVMWLPADKASPWTGTNPSLQPNAGVTLNTSAEIFLQSTTAGATVMWYGETL